ncbi:hypothetical protein RI367_008344 [Sorochytrium milnesiophthora]
MSASTERSILELPSQPPELVEEILVHAGVDACAALRHLPALRRTLTAYVRAGNYTDNCEKAMLKTLVDCRWSAGVQAMIDADIRHPFCRAAELDWSDIVLPVSSIRRLYLWCLAANRRDDAPELLSILTYNRINAGADCADLLQWGVQQVPGFLSELSSQYIKHGRNLDQLRALHQELGVYLSERNLAKTLLLLAAQHGNLDLVQALDSINPEVLQEHSGIIKLAAESGYLPIVQASLNQWHEIASAVAAETKDTRVLQILKQFKPELSIIDAFARNASRAYLPTLQHIIRSESPTPDPQVFCAAASTGRTDIMDWMLSECPLWTSAEAIKCAAGAGHQELAQRLSDHFGVPLKDCILQPRHLQALVDSGHLRKLKWIEKCCQLSCDERLLLSGIKSRNLAVAQLLHRHCQDVEFTAEMLTEACRTGNLRMVQWVYQHLPATVRPADAIDTAAGRHLDVADFLRLRRSEGCWRDTFQLAIYDECTLASIQWVARHYPEQLTEDALSWVAEYSRADIIEHLHMLPNAPFSAATMDSAAASGDLELVRWFHLNRKEGCTAHAMKRAAQSGYLSIVKFLHEHDYPMCNWRAIERSPEYIQEWWRSIESTNNSSARE